MFAAVPSPASADDAPRVAPGAYVLPGASYRLGFDGRFVGYGMLVQRVHWGSMAQSIGLESGDVILAINGQRIFSGQHYLNLLAQSGGYVTLTVRDVRTGSHVTLFADFNQYFPAAPYGG
jgi:S1-C subfamily serine protease